MRLLFISNLYPSSAEPQRASFNLHLMKALSCCAEIRVVAPYYWFPGIHLLCGKKIPPPKECIEGIDVTHPRVFYTPGLFIDKHWRMYAGSVRSHLEQVVREFNPDEIMAGFAYPDGLAILSVCRKLGRKCSIRVNGSDFRLRIRQAKFRNLVLRALTEASQVFCHGEALKRDMVKEGIDSGKIVAFENGVDQDLFRYKEKEAARRELEPYLSADLRRCMQMEAKNVILFVGNLVAVKGINIAVEAMQYMVGDVLVVIGDGPMRKMLQKTISRLGLTERVFFAGVRSQKEIARWMNMADRLCLPSRSEGMPNVVLEALTSGLPVVATPVGSCADLLSGEKTAVLIERDMGVESTRAGEVQALVKALIVSQRLIVDRESLATRYRDRFQWDRAAKTILEALLTNKQCG